jgi:anti-sigma-K factor RskA
VSASDHNRFEEDIGAYLLGALANGEDEAFEGHLATCHVCQDEVERMRGAADALPRSVEQYEPPPALKAALMEQVYADAPPAVAGAGARAAKPRRSLAERLGIGGAFARLTPQIAVMATALVLAVGVVAGYGVSQLSSGDGSTHAGVGGARSVAAAVDPTRVGRGRATLVVPKDGSGGAQLRVAAMPQPRSGQLYQVWLQRRGQVEPGPLFSVDRNGNGVGAVPGDLHGVTAVLVTRERAGGAQQPTEAPVVRAKV